MAKQKPGITWHRGVDNAIRCLRWALYEPPGLPESQQRDEAMEALDILQEMERELG